MSEPKPIPSYPRGPALFALLLLASCQPGEPVGAGAYAIAGGELDVLDEFPAVCAVRVLVPPDEDNPEPRERECTGVLVDLQMVLTAASCIDDNLEADALGDVEVVFGTAVSGGTSFAVDDAELFRYFIDDEREDFALLRIDADPGVAPLPINVRPLEAGDQGTEVALVGYGETGDAQADFGARRVVRTQLLTVNDDVVIAGEDEATTCNGDSGGPVIADLGDGPVVIAVTAGQGRCDRGILRNRVDVVATDFIFPYIDRFNGPCSLDAVCVEVGCRSPDPDCDLCLWNEVCEEDCPTRDLDCELGAFAGQACTSSGQCERLGRCVAAPDDETFTYCTQACDPTRASPCPQNMTCEDLGTALGGLQCVFAESALQGATCDSGGSCRSGICEGRICVNECSPAQSNCPAGFECGPSVELSGANVCFDPARRGGGGFCAIATPGTPSRAPIGGGLVVLLALAALIARRR